MDLRRGYRRIVLILAVLAGVSGLVAGIATVAEQAGEFSGLVGVILCLISPCIAPPSLSFACTGIVLWFGGLGMCRLVMWVAHGFDGKPDSHAGVQTPPWARVKVGNCLRLVAIGLVGVASFIGAGMFLEATAGREKEPEDTAPPPPAETVLSDISVDKVELNDLCAELHWDHVRFHQECFPGRAGRSRYANCRAEFTKGHHLSGARHAQTRSPARRGKTFFLWERRASSESPRHIQQEVRVDMGVP